ncbi:uncharacterized protein [Blastocystis hominis]|uniref:Uncharacterized protein n=1 Tax=Blastocystis hominis TaxID=12968 RepID=D8M6J3_BLAHO|nr:uncharacterized protein [Blastocystis hominis]CBK23411.2 unnamed protein product [Blastocystis hominis]|eukprot:XP_012897459.1 uncharacterized protein [Blastocystis hominis]
MSKEDRYQAIVQMSSRLLQFEELYSRMVYQLNKEQKDELSTREGQRWSFTVNSLLSSCVLEEEKLLQSLIRAIDDEIVQSIQVKSVKRKKKKSMQNSIFDSLLNVESIAVGSPAVAYINGTWIMVKVMQIDNGIYPTQSFAKHNPSLHLHRD